MKGENVGVKSSQSSEWSCIGKRAYVGNREEHLRLIKVIGENSRVKDLRRSLESGDRHGGARYTVQSLFNNIK